MIKRKIKVGSMGRAFLIFVLFMALMLMSVDYAKKGSIDRQQKSLEMAIQRDLTYCYATTGSYPKTLDYVKYVYGLTYDEEVFDVNFEVRGSKIPPIVTVKRTGAK